MKSAGDLSWATFRRSYGCEQCSKSIMCLLCKIFGCCGLALSTESSSNLGIISSVRSGSLVRAEYKQILQKQWRNGSGNQQFGYIFFTQFPWWGGPNVTSALKPRGFSDMTFFLILKRRRRCNITGPPPIEGGVTYFYDKLTKEFACQV